MLTLMRIGMSIRSTWYRGRMEPDKSPAAILQLRECGAAGEVNGRSFVSAANGFVPDPPVRVKEYKIAASERHDHAECHLAAYRQAGFPVGCDRLTHAATGRGRRRPLGNSGRS